MIRRMIGWIAAHWLPLLGVGVFLVLGVSFSLPFLIDRGRPALRMSAGAEGTRRHTVASYLSQQAAANHLTIDLKPAVCSEDCLNQLKADALDVAIVSNGVVVPDDDDIMVLGAIQLEAVHVLVRKDMTDGPLSEMVRGKRVNLGEKGSTEWLLAREFLAHGRLKTGDVIPTELSKAELIDRARAIRHAEGGLKDALIAELPDCLIVLATMPSIIVQHLVEAAEYRIIPIPATRAFLLDNLQDSRGKSTTVEREFLERTTIPAASYFTTRGFPESDCETIGVRLVVVARKGVSARAIRPLMKTIFEGEFSRRILPKSPRDLGTPYAIHPAAIAYLDRDKPVIVQEVTDTINMILSGFGAFSAGALSIYGFLRRKKSRQPADYFAEIRTIDQIARGALADETVPIRPRELAKYLDERLTKLRQDLIEDICEGRIKGDQVIANILSLLKDARRNLSIEHARAA